MKEENFKLVADSLTTMTELVMPNDTNPLGNLMGGNLVKWMDVASAICAARHSEAHVVTVAIDYVSFQEAIHLGDVVTIKATATRAFNTSVEVFVEVFASCVTGKELKKANQAYFTFVALDKASMKPIPVPKLKALTTEEQRLFEGASRRRELRLVLGGRMKASEATEVRTFFENME